jgi:hypothetical protein
MTPTKLIWEINELCGSDKSIRDKLLKVIDKKILRIGTSEYAVSDPSGGLELSAFFLAEILKAGLNLEKQKLSGLISFVTRNADTTSLKELKSILILGEVLKSKGIVFPVLRSTMITARDEVCPWTLGV